MDCSDGNTGGLVETGRPDTDDAVGGVDCESRANLPDGGLNILVCAGYGIEPHMPYEIRFDRLKSSVRIMEMVGEFAERVKSVLGDGVFEYFKRLINLNANGYPTGKVYFDKFSRFEAYLESSFCRECGGNVDKFRKALVLADEFRDLAFYVMMASSFGLEMADYLIKNFKDGENLYLEKVKKLKVSRKGNAVNKCDKAAQGEAEFMHEIQLYPSVTFYTSWLKKCVSFEERSMVFEYLKEAGNEVMADVFFFATWLKSESSYEDRKKVYECLLSAGVVPANYFFVEWVRRSDSSDEVICVFELMAVRKVDVDAVNNWEVDKVYFAFAGCIENLGISAGGGFLLKIWEMVARYSSFECSWGEQFYGRLKGFHESLIRRSGAAADGA